MAEADITTLTTLADGLAYGPAMRGAMATLQTRLKPGDIGAASTTTAGLIQTATDAEAVQGTLGDVAVTPSGLTARLRSAVAMVTSSHTVAGAYNVNWANGLNFRVNATANITAITESAGPAAGSIIEGTLEVVNTGGSAITVDSTALPYGLDGVLTVAVGTREIIFLTSTGT